MNGKRGIGGEVVGVAVGIMTALGVSQLVSSNARVDITKVVFEDAVAAPRKAKAEPVAAATAAGARRYLSAKWDPIHFPPAILTATNDQCLACHKEVLTDKVRTASPAGLKASDSLAWYQTLDSYQGNQETFHARHLATPFAKQVMNLQCSFCHKGNDPREESGGSSASTAVVGDAKLRKMVNPESTCLLCHGRFPVEFMEGLEGTWPELREGLESADAPNGCLTCHAELFRTVRHQVNYLNADAIEKLAKEGSSDACYGCHGGRAWYRTSYPYPRHPWPDMAPEVPDWAKDRPTESKPEHVAGVKKAEQKAK